MSGSGAAPVADVVDHGGNLTRAQRRFPDAPGPWLDLSTGISPHPYPFGEIPASAFTSLPQDSRLETLLEAAAQAYGAPSAANIVAAPGTQALLPLVARLIPRGKAAILSPTYAEHFRAASLAGHETVETGDPAALCRADYAVVVNPNNPDGRIVERSSLLELADAMHRSGGLLLVDEAFMDVGPAGGSLVADAGRGNVVVLRSFGKFFGLAGVRLGFAFGAEDAVSALRSHLGPWAVSGPAIEIGIRALADRGWRQAMRQRLADDAGRLDRLLTQAGLDVVGGTALYRLVRLQQARSLFDALGEAGILVRSFGFDERALRIGLPGDDAGFSRLERALVQWRGNGRVRI